MATPEAELNMLPDHTPSRLGVCEATPTPDSPTPPTPATEDTGPIEQVKGGRVCGRGNRGGGRREVRV